MPVVGFECAECKRRFPLEDIVNEVSDEPFDHFEYEHAENEYSIGGDDLLTLAVNESNSNQNPRRQGAHLSASMAGGCMREFVLKRTTDYWADPLKLWRQMEGTLIHEGLTPRAHWLVELPLEPLELEPGLKVDAVADRVSTDYKRVRDIKTHKCPPGKWVYPTKAEKEQGKGSKYEYYRNIFPPGENETLQVNIQCHAVAKQFNVSVPKGEIKVLQLGVGDTRLSHRLFPVEPMSLEQLRERVAPGFKLLQMVMQIEDEDARRKATAEMPLEGREMFVSKDGTCKCDKYCLMRQACDALLPDQEMKF